MPVQYQNIISGFQGFHLDEIITLQYAVFSFEKRKRYLGNGDLKDPLIELCVLH